jgi:TonB family protein
LRSADCGGNFVMRVYRGLLLSVVCTGIALAGSQLARAQDATSAILPERSEPVESAPTPIPKKRTSKASVEISAKTPSQKPAPVAEDTSRAEELATPATTAEKKTRAKRRATSAPQPNASEFPVVGTMSMSAAKEMAISAPLPEYPYQARRANITGSGVCVMIVDTASGNVTSAVMAESTGNAVLDKVTTDAFRKWRFKPGAVSQIRVPISYE